MVLVPSRVFLLGILLLYISCAYRVLLLHEPRVDHSSQHLFQVQHRLQSQHRRWICCLGQQPVLFLYRIIGIVSFLVFLFLLLLLCRANNFFFLHLRILLDPLWVPLWIERILGVCATRVFIP